MTHTVRPRLQLRRAGLATTVVLGCALVAVAEVPALANAVTGHSTATSASQDPDLVPNFLDLPSAARAATGVGTMPPAAAASKAISAQNGAATTAQTASTVNGLTPSTVGTSTIGGSTTTGSTVDGSSNGGTSVATGTVGSASVPSVLLAAYEHAVTLAPASCHMPVSLLEAIGQVESGNLSGQSITTDHRAYPGVYGPLLDGTDGFAAIKDTDGGRLDGNSTWDRAVGPMQFIPGTWAIFGTDGDGDGKADPQNVYDAAATATKYLCYGGRDLSTSAGIDAAVLSYNQSTAYLQLVLEWKAAFESGQTSVKTIKVVPNLPNVTPKTTTTTTPKLQAVTPTKTTQKTPSTGQLAPSVTATPKPSSPASTATSTPKPSASATSPSASATSPRASATSPSASATSPSASATSPSASATSPSASATSPSASATSPSASATSPSASATTTTATSPEKIQASLADGTVSLSAPTTGNAFKWTVTEGSAPVTVAGSATANASFTVPADGTYAIVVTVDGTSYKGTLQVTSGSIKFTA